MTRTAIPIQTLLNYGTKVEDISFTAADAANDHQITHPGGDVFLMVKNGSGSSHDTTVQGVSSPRTFLRDNDLVVSTGAGEDSVFCIPDKGFDQGAGVVHIDITADTSIEFAAFRFVETS